VLTLRHRRVIGYWSAIYVVCNLINQFLINIIASIIAGTTNSTKVPGVEEALVDIKEQLESGNMLTIEEVAEKYLFNKEYAEILLNRAGVRPSERELTALVDNPIETVDDSQTKATSTDFGINRQQILLRGL